MKNLRNFILPIITLVFLISCSNDDVVNFDNDTENIAVEGDYFPSQIGNYWKYDVSTTNNLTSNNTVSQDSLYLISESASTLMLDVNNGLPANGPIIGLLSSGTLTKSDTTLSIDGVLELPEELSEFVDFDINLDNFVLYNTEANNNTQLASNSNSITENFDGYPLTINYELTSTAVSFSETLSLNGNVYSNVIISKLALNLEVTTTINVSGIDLPLAILEPNDVLISTNYYVEGIGLVQADSNTSYQISDSAITALNAAGVTIPIPTSGSTTIDQVIDNYFVAE